jgi:hypothetical protein
MPQQYQIDVSINLRVGDGITIGHIIFVRCHPYEQWWCVVQCNNGRRMHFGLKFDEMIFFPSTKNAENLTTE